MNWKETKSILKQDIALESFDKKEFRIINSNESPTQYRNGKYYHCYTYFRNLGSNLYLLDKVGEALKGMIEYEIPIKPDRFLPIPEAGINIADKVSDLTKIPNARIRKDLIAYDEISILLDNSGYKDAAKYLRDIINDPQIMKEKLHGIKEMLLGDVNDGNKLMLIDNVINDSGTKFDAIRLYERILRDKKYSWCGTLVPVEIDNGDGRENLRKAGYELYSFMKVSEIVEILYRYEKIDMDTYDMLMNELEIKI
jgi:hypothetical protein